MVRTSSNSISFYHKSLVLLSVGDFCNFIVSQVMSVNKVLIAMCIWIHQKWMSQAWWTRTPHWRENSSWWICCPSFFLCEIKAQELALPMPTIGTSSPRRTCRNWAGVEHSESLVQKATQEWWCGIREWISQQLFTVFGFSSCGLKIDHCPLCDSQPKWLDAPNLSCANADSPM